MSLMYKDAGVISRQDAREKIKARVAQTCGPRVVGGVGGFAVCMMLMVKDFWLLEPMGLEPN